MKTTDFLTGLVAKGFCCFTLHQVKEAMGVSTTAARASLRRLKHKGEIAQPLAGFYVIVPPEYRVLGCRPAEHFIDNLMQYIQAPYYVGLLSAAQHYGAGHHRPQQLQVITNQKRRTIICGRVKIVFITKKNMEKFESKKINTPQGEISISSPEVTAMDIVSYPKRCGGLENVLTVLTDLTEKIDPDKLLRLTLHTEEITWVQRLGYLLESINDIKLSAVLMDSLKKRRVHIRALSLNKVVKNSSDSSHVTKNTKWKLIVRKKPEPDK